MSRGNRRFLLTNLQVQIFGVTDALQLVTSVWTPISVYKFWTVQDCIRPNVMANRLAAIKSSRRIQCSSSSVHMMWQYRPDAIQCSTSSWISCLDMDRETATFGRKGNTVRTLFRFPGSFLHTSQCFYHSSLLEYWIETKLVPLER
jgi:hypothetical protein